MITTSHRVKAATFREQWFQDRRLEMGEDERIHRKIWEFAVIGQTYLDTVSYPYAIQSGRIADAQGVLLESLAAGGGFPVPNVLGFGVGNEPLPAWLYHQGARVTATDAPLSIVQSDWTSTNQHAAGLDNLRKLPHLPIPQTGKLIYKPVDMNKIPAELLHGEYDFVWSAGSFEHLGGLDAGIRFFLKSMRCLKPGGIACHTTEYNSVSNKDTLNGPGLCIYRKCDLERLGEELADQGDSLFPLDLSGGDLPEDLYIDRNPYHGIPSHLSLYIGHHVATSVVLIARRGQGGDQ